MKAKQLQLSALQKTKKKTPWREHIDFFLAQGWPGCRGYGYIENSLCGICGLKVACKKEFMARKRENSLWRAGARTIYR